MSAGLMAMKARAGRGRERRRQEAGWRRWRRVWESSRCMTGGERRPPAERWELRWQSRIQAHPTESKNREAEG